MDLIHYVVKDGVLESGAADGLRINGHSPPVMDTQGALRTRQVRNSEGFGKIFPTHREKFRPKCSHFELHESRRHIKSEISLCVGILLILSCFYVKQFFIYQLECE